MHTKTTVIALLAMTLLAAGCGGGDVSADEQSTLETREDAARAYSFERVYYDGPDFDYAGAVGITYYNCSGPTLTYGTVTAWSRDEGHNACSYSPYECPDGSPWC
ncbi:hypothetical protein [Pyxidicoccus caerfyrddinensis]|uniref:hypothetical protein n=1 Tax=Pyxidicoccus caerfyrddinensis TaxID=2709663 RepID=UPI0013DD6B85|nr:hypothetical protein [Pyxidicoccus caerfyrddinensis]